MLSTCTKKTAGSILGLDVVIPSTATPNPLVVVVGDIGGYPNEYESTDVAAIELQTTAEIVISLVKQSFSRHHSLAAVCGGGTDGARHSYRAFRRASDSLPRLRRTVMMVRCA